MPPTTTGMCDEPRRLQPRQHLARHRQMRAREDRQADAMHARPSRARRSRRASGGCRRRRRPCRRRSRAPRSARRRWNGRRGRACRPGISAAAQASATPAATSARSSSRSSAALPRLRPDAGRRAIFAEFAAQRRAPFAGRDAGFGRLDRGRHDVAPARRRRAQIRAARPRRAPRRAPRARLASRAICSRLGCAPKACRSDRRPRSAATGRFR